MILFQINYVLLKLFRNEPVMNTGTEVFEEPSGMILIGLPGLTAILHGSASAGPTRDAINKPLTNSNNIFFINNPYFSDFCYVLFLKVVF